MQEILALVKEEISMNEPLLEYGDVSRTEILRLRQEAELEAEITNKRNSYFKDVQAEFNETEEELESVRQALGAKKTPTQPKNVKCLIARHCEEHSRYHRIGALFAPEKR